MDIRLSSNMTSAGASPCLSPSHHRPVSPAHRPPKEEYDRPAREIEPMIYTDLLPWTSTGGPETREFLLRVAEISIDYVRDTFDRNVKILDFHQPEQLKEVLDLEIPNKPLNLEQLLSDCKDALKYQVKTGHPRFMNQLSCGIEVVSLAGEWLTAAANTNMFTYEIAPVFILMEQVTMKHMRDIIGYKNGDSILAPGGSVSNLYAALAARHKMFPEYKKKGLKALPGELVMFTSLHSHYSLMGAAAAMGLGTDNLIEVPVDERGHMLPAELDRLIDEQKTKGKVPFFVCATSGTTVMGAFDPLHAVADICEKHKLWFHVDAAWGGGVLLSKNQRHKMNGVERSNSITWNPHKLMGTLLQCSTVHFKEDGLLISCNQMCADYLFQQDKPYDVNYDTGDKVIQCGRHNDIFKLWLLWRSKGDEGFEKHIDHLFEMTEYMVQRMKQHSDKFELMNDEPECTNVCFWYVPYRLRTTKAGPERHKLLGEIQPILKGRMMTAGTFMIGYQPLDHHPNFFRNIISSQAVRREDIDFMLEELDRLGYDL
ncbi:glutamate decarboxylase-like [Eriocheir sinensis]|uniref:glutamate decarboxylase-like n=1 Tax=Eriocheir sinensis TaxID=95602 RepID=UPI0021C5F0E3|nr:glutamate decarboxylase-like [Eriocheir sinensis]